MAVSEFALDPETSDLVTTAFNKSWQFVRTDPELAHNDMNEMRARLSHHITRLADDDVKFDAVEQMLIGLQRAGRITRLQMIRLQARYLRETKP